MANLDFVAAVPANGAGAVNKTLLRGYLAKRVPYSLTSAEDSQNFVTTDPATGDTLLNFIQNGHTYAFDATDTTTAHDGVLVLVSSEGNRYKLDDLNKPYSVLDKDLTTPPGSPTIGDAYLVYSASSGAWSGQTGKIAIYTARGWSFAAPPIGFNVYVEDEGAYYHIDENGDWIAGLGNVFAADESVLVKALIGGGKRVHWIVENQTTNTPPVSPATGEAYIVAGSPTGAWVGQAGKIAEYSGSAWVFYTPVEGFTGYDKALDNGILFDGTNWQTNASSVVKVDAVTVSVPVTEISFTTGFLTANRKHIFELDSIVPSTNDDQLLVEVSTDGGATWKQTTYLASYLSSNSGGGSGVVVLTTAIPMSQAASSSAGVWSSGSYGWNGQVQLRPVGTSGRKFIEFSGSYMRANGTTFETGRGGGFWNGANDAVNAIRFRFASGNTAAGKITHYVMKA